MKPTYFLGTTREEIRSFPKEIRQEIGFAIETAQMGGKAINVLPLVGFKGAGVLEIFSDFNGNTYRIIYTVKFSERIYVLHAFQKKSKRGIATPRREMELVRARLKAAQDYYEREKEKKPVERKNVKATRG